MFETRPGTALEKINNRKKFLMELITLGFFFALSINLFSACIQNLIFEAGQDTAKWAWGAFFSGLGILVTVAFAFHRLVFKKEAETLDLAVTLPVLLDPKNKTASVVQQPEYEFSVEAEKLFSMAKKEIARPFFSEWTDKEDAPAAFLRPGDFCYEKIMALMEASVMVLLKNFGVRALTHSAMFHGEFRNLSGKIPPRKLQKEHWPERIRENPFLNARNLQNILVPAGGRLTHEMERKKDAKKPKASILKISAEYVSFSFSISPYWTTLRDVGKARDTFSIGADDDVAFLRIPVDISMELRGGVVSFKGIYVDHREMAFQYAWAQKLKENARRRMDWGYFLRKGRKGVDET